MIVITRKRPTSITVIAWIFIITACLMILICSLGLFVYKFTKQNDADITLMPENVSGPAKLRAHLYQIYDLLAFLQILLAIFIIFASIQFLKLHAWARSALEGVSWLGITALVGEWIMQIYIWINVTPSILPGENVPGINVVSVIGIVMHTLTIAVIVLPIGVIIWFLRGKTIRDVVV